MRPENTWYRSDAEIASAFADELEGRFTPFALASFCQVQDTEASLNADLDPVQPITRNVPSEVRLQIRRLKSTKASGYDGIDGRGSLPREGRRLSAVSGFQRAIPDHQFGFRHHQNKFIE
ncbi:GH22164 [Drosophila grimshawi]|uniref:GH22164 n=1 Tax=Drosophila grimshawi TaxID=7222 RepID=B4K1K2_DROGR|nr:GH22164 [Drosophila grimshawi]